MARNRHDPRACTKVRRFRMAPTQEQALRMIQDLESIAPRDKLPALLGVPVRTLNQWRSGFAGMPWGIVRLVWLTWALLLHPEQCATVADLITWGRFAKPPDKPKPGP